jgi:hypothetical protein
VQLAAYDQRSGRHHFEEIQPTTEKDPEKKKRLEPRPLTGKNNFVRYKDQGKVSNLRRLRKVALRKYQSY